MYTLTVYEKKTDQMLQMDRQEEGEELGVFLERLGVVASIRNKFANLKGEGPWVADGYFGQILSKYELSKK